MTNVELISFSLNFEVKWCGLSMAAGQIQWLI